MTFPQSTCFCFNKYDLTYFVKKLIAFFIFSAIVVWSTTCHRSSRSILRKINCSKVLHRTNDGLILRVLSIYPQKQQTMQIWSLREEVLRILSLFQRYLIDFIANICYFHACNKRIPSYALEAYKLATKRTFFSRFLTNVSE